MVTGRRLGNAVVVLLFAAFCFGLFRLVQLRYTTGDIFPTYSSHRADPLGTKVLYESLRTLPDHDVVRNERPLEQLRADADTTLFLIGVSDPWITDAARNRIERFVQSGGRLVMTFYPRFEPSPEDNRANVATPSPTPSATPTGTPPPPETEPTPRGIRFTNLLERWEVKVNVAADDEEDVSATRASPEPLEEQLSWHSDATFESHNPEWRTIYSMNRGPVLIERRYGEGSVVVATDSYFLSNEAQLEERRPALLAWLLESRRTVIFEESHLGIEENPSVATLLRRYGLAGFVVGFLIFIALWLWRNAAHALKPRSSAADTGEIVSGRDSFAGFVHLLRRGIPPAQVASVCLAEWRKTATARRPAAASDEAVAAVLRDSKNPANAYNELNKLLSPKKWKTKSAS